MLLTDGPNPVAFSCDGKDYLIQTSVIKGGNVRRVIAEIVKKEGGEAKDYNYTHVLAKCSDIDYMPLMLELNCTCDGRPVTKAESEVLFENLNVIILEQWLIDASGYEEIKNYHLAQEESRQNESSPTKNTSET